MAIVYFVTGKHQLKRKGHQRKTGIGSVKKMLSKILDHQTKGDLTKLTKPHGSGPYSDQKLVCVPDSSPVCLEFCTFWITLLHPYPVLDVWTVRLCGSSPLQPPAFYLDAVKDEIYSLELPTCVDKLIDLAIRVDSRLQILSPCKWDEHTDLSNVPREYLDLKGVFSKSRAASLPLLRSYDCAIDLLPDHMDRLSNSALPRRYWKATLVKLSPVARYL
ncbi:hypothetical protein QQF64_023774 [Cirrhinus molitorella]|uniref:Uncharacterized protein n=1 Tax=Cirrhinus molitorella TaxID=172907 RepID=A0ABR3NK81_9TELE